MTGAIAMWLGSWESWDRFLLEIGEHVTVRLCFYQSLDIEVSNVKTEMLHQIENGGGLN